MTVLRQDAGAARIATARLSTGRSATCRVTGASEERVSRSTVSRASPSHGPTGRPSAVRPSSRQTRPSGDSCDEFPFAGVYESGALNGVDHGKDCAQVTAVKADSTGDLATDWPTV